MKESNQLPDDPQLGALLRQGRVSPGLPPRFQQNVWRRIEDAEAPAKSESWLDALANLIMRPRFAVAAAVVVLLAGILTGTMEGRQMARHDAQMNYLASVAPQSVR
ncbi:MAG TPA: hypothetical protein VH251_08625 [Verrucomicrobiae bacterium]|nr:hypothetical protein [Verrucomicrobiae bacterium]